MTTTHLYPIDRVHVLHTIEYDPPDLFESLVFPHARDRVPLDEDVTVCQELDGLSSSVAAWVK